LTWRERRILLLAMLLLPAIALGLRVRGLRGVRAVLAGCYTFPEVEVGGECSLANARAVARLVAAAARHGPYRAKCLPVSLVLAWLLRRQGIETELRLGVRKTAAGLEAHAWIELGGIPLIDSPQVHERFVAFEPVIALRS
jgi:hypothetical protein